MSTEIDEEEDMQDRDDREAYEDMRSDLDSGDCVTINDKDEVFFSGDHLGTLGQTWETEEEMFAAIQQEMEVQKSWPSIYRISDHGNVSLLGHDGREIRGWV